MPTMKAQRHTAHDLELAGQMRREDYKAIKHMDKVALASYLSRVWKRGYDAGIKAAEAKAKTATPTAKSEEG